MQKVWMKATILMAIQVVHATTAIINKIPFKFIVNVNVVKFKHAQPGKRLEGQSSRTAYVRLLI
jgi:hypothetical protein